MNKTNSWKSTAILLLIILFAVAICSVIFAYREGMKYGIKETMSYIIDEVEEEGYIKLSDPQTQEVTELIEMEFSLYLCSQSLENLEND